MDNDTNAPDVGNKDGLAGGDLAVGRELDWLVAERVMGFSDRSKELYSDNEWATWPDGNSVRHFSNVPHYSTNPTDAALVVAWVRSRPFSKRERIARLIQDELTRRKTPELSQHGGGRFAMSAVLIMAAPEDWCRAALRSLLPEPANTALNSSPTK